MSLSMFVRARRPGQVPLDSLDMHISTRARHFGIGRTRVRTRLVEVLASWGILLGYLSGLVSHTKTMAAMATERHLQCVMVGMDCMLMVMRMVMRMVGSSWSMHVGAPVGFGITVTSV